MSLLRTSDLVLEKQIVCSEICWTFAGMGMECGHWERECTMPDTGDLYDISFLPDTVLEVVFTLNILDDLSVAGG